MQLEIQSSFSPTFVGMFTRCYNKQPSVHFWEHHETFAKHFCNKNTMKPIGSLKNIFQAFWECPSPTGFTCCCKAWGTIYHEPKLCTSWGLWMGRFLCLLLNSGRVLTPIISRHNNFPHTWGVGLISLPISKREIHGYKGALNVHYRFSPNALLMAMPHLTGQNIMLPHTECYISRPFREKIVIFPDRSVQIVIYPDRSTTRKN
jgi:hypothetical protein